MRAIKYTYIKVYNLSTRLYKLLTTIHCTGRSKVTNYRYIKNLVADKSSHGVYQIMFMGTIIAWLITITLGCQFVG